MSSSDIASAPAEWRRRHSRFLVLTCAAVALTGCFASVATNVIGSFVVPDYSFVADTISDLGAGELEILQDLGMYGFAAALFACAIAASHLHPGTRRWSAGVLGLAMLASLVLIIAARNEYGDQDRDGIVIHRYLVVALAVLFPSIALMFRKGLGNAHPGYGTLSVICAVAWIVAAPLFPVLPTAIDGLWERILAMIMIVWVVAFAKFMIDFSSALKGGSGHRDQDTAP